MRKPPPLVVFGATGTIGTRLCAHLVAEGRPVRAVSHNRPVQVAGVETARADAASGEGLADALNGARVLFLLTGDMPHQTEAELLVVQAAAKAGIVHVVKLSTWGAETEAFSIARIHRPVELAIEASGLGFTFLRPNCFMQNFATYYLPALRESGVLRLPCGDARISFIDARDIARVAAAILSNPFVHDKKAYALSGSRALTHDEAVAILAEVSGKRLRYEGVSDEEFRSEMERSGAPSRYVDDVLDLCASYRRGEAEASTSAVSDIAGRPPTPFPEFARDHAATWR